VALDDAGQMVQQGYCQSALGIGEPAPGAGKVTGCGASALRARSWRWSTC